MKLTTALLTCSTTLTSTASASVLLPRSPSHPDQQHVTRIPTSYESAVLGRRILALTPIGTMATVFQAGDTKQRRPDDLDGKPYNLMEYIADCEDSGNPTILAFPIGTGFHNADAGSNVSLAVRWTPPPPPPPGREDEKKESAGWLEWLGLGRRNHHHHHRHLYADELAYNSDSDSDSDSDSEQEEEPPNRPWRPSPAALPRFSLIGYLEPIPDADDITTPTGRAIARCYTKQHPDARFWLPGSPVHEAHFVRLVVEQVYWVGGFGDRAYIGWIPIDEW